MKVGISINSTYPGKDQRAGPRQMILRAAAASRAGLDTLFVGDHHITPVPYYQNVPMMGRLLAEWDVRPAGALFLLPLWNPVLVAEQCSTLACIAEGPFILQCGLGTGAAQFGAMGASIRYRPSSFEQSIDVVRRLWAGETVSLDGRWQIDSAAISPLPPTPISIWIGASARPAIERAARLGDAWLADPGITRTQAARSIDFYRECLEREGKRAGTIAIRRDFYVAASRSEAEETRRLIEERGHRGFDFDALTIGDAEQVAESFSELEALGYTDVIVRNLHPDHGRAVASIERLREVKSLLA